MIPSSPNRDVKPAVIPDHDTIVFWRGINEGRFLFQRCKACHKAQFYARAICSHCQGEDLGWEEASGRGKIASFSVVHRAPIAAFKADVPYVLALVDLDEGPRFMCNVVNCDPNSVRIGDSVNIVYELRDGSDQQVPQVERISND
jgi:uncharacterized OB-fold protein